MSLENKWVVTYTDDMNKLTITLSVVMLALVTLAADKPTDPKPIQTGKGHNFACTDYSGNKAFIVNKKGKVVWEHEVKHGNDLWVLPNGNILINNGNSAQEINRKKEIVWEYKSKGEVFTCQRLPNGNTLVGECTIGRLVEVSPTGKITNQINLLKEGAKGNHGFIRNARKTPNGSYLVTHYAEGVVREYNPDGKIIREIPAPSGPHSIARLNNGNTIIAEGDKKKNPRIWEVDKDGKTVWSIEKDELPGISLKFMTGFQRLKNGNTVMSNWVGHGQAGKAPHIIEVTKDKKVVWTFDDHTTMRTVSNVQLLDEKGDATKFGLIH